jgi:hypothetical protein
MAVLSLQANMTTEQIYALLAQLSSTEKLEIAKALRAEATSDRWRILAQTLPDVPEIDLEEIVQEVKLARQARREQKQ